MGEIAESVFSQLVTTFYYRKLGAGISQARRVQTLLGKVDGGWELIARDVVQGALRTFALPRISRFKVSPKKFEKPVSIVGSDHLKPLFDIWSVAGDFYRQVVRVELNDAARLDPERLRHPPQEISSQMPRRTQVEIQFEVGRLEEVLRWVLSFGSQAKVLGPPELVKMVSDEVETMRG